MLDPLAAAFQVQIALRAYDYFGGQSLPCLRPLLAMYKGDGYLLLSWRFVSGISYKFLKLLAMPGDVEVFDWDTRETRQRGHVLGRTQH